MVEEVNMKSLTTFCFWEMHSMGFMSREHLQTNRRKHQLCSWKEIASYLGVGVRTVQRYERERGMPVRRSESNSRSEVRALTSEIDGWWLVKTQDGPPAPLRSAKRLRRTKGTRPAFQST
jgi:transcriptional regulator with XRE-family HTH domain